MSEPVKRKRLSLEAREELLEHLQTDSLVRFERLIPILGVRTTGSVFKWLIRHRVRIYKTPFYKVWLGEFMEALANDEKDFSTRDASGWGPSNVTKFLGERYTTKPRKFDPSRSQEDIAAGRREWGHKLQLGKRRTPGTPGGRRISPSPSKTEVSSAAGGGDRGSDG